MNRFLKEGVAMDEAQELTKTDRQKEDEQIAKLEATSCCVVGGQIQLSSKARSFLEM